MIICVFHSPFHTNTNIDFFSQTSHVFLLKPHMLINFSKRGRVRDKEQKSAGENIPFIKSIDKGFEEKDGGNKEGKEREKYFFNLLGKSI